MYPIFRLTKNNLPLYRRNYCQRDLLTMFLKKKHNPYILLHEPQYETPKFKPNIKYSEGNSLHSKIVSDIPFNERYETIDFDPNNNMIETVHKR